MLSAWLFAKRLKKYQQMKELEGGGGSQQMPGVARDFHSSSPGDGMKVHETADADVVAFEGMLVWRLPSWSDRLPRLGILSLRTWEGSRPPSWAPSKRLTPGI